MDALTRSTRPTRSGCLANPSPRTFRTPAYR